MTKKQMRFCDEYLIDCNATQAAIRAGYSARTAAQIGQENLTKPDIKNYIDEHLKNIHDSTIADAVEVMRYLTSVVRGESRASEIVVESEGEGCSTAREIEKSPSEKDKLKAAELLGKRYRLFTDAMNVDMDADVNISIDYGDE